MSKKEIRKIGISTSDTPIHYSVGILVKLGNTYLLIDRKKLPYGFAGIAGHVDQDEEPNHAALRELNEETGISADSLEFILEEEIIWNYCKEVRSHYWYLYKVEVNDPALKIATDEAKSYGWFTPEEIKNLELEEVWSYWFKKLNII